ncbi:MAG: hypothetical protein OXQ89_04615, partial [Rhodospirillaceae bacterium]|nr:hypothetical protein [Rhodospirillaceae bacterium]
DDLKRIGALVKHYNHAKGGTLRRGFLGFSIAAQGNQSRSADERMEEQINRITNAVRRDFNTGCSVQITPHSKPRKHGDWKIWSVVVEVAAKRDGTG